MDTKTLQLQKLIKSRMDTVQGGTYHVNAPDTAAYPYKVFALQTADLGDKSRDDITMIVDVWDKSSNQKTVDTIADNLEALFNGANLPQTGILPTIWRESRYPVPDENKSLQHVQMTFYIQNYERT